MTTETIYSLLHVETSAIRGRKEVGLHVHRDRSLLETSVTRAGPYRPQSYGLSETSATRGRTTQTTYGLSETSATRGRTTQTTYGLSATSATIGRTTQTTYGLSETSATIGRKERWASRPQRPQSYGLLETSATRSICNRYQDQ